jgi:hypothetical protein
MIYQLIHHNNVDQYEFVEQSSDIQTEEEKIAWQNAAMFKQVLPSGRTWSIIDENHAWFTKSKNDDTMPVANRNPDKPLSFEEVVTVSHDQTLQERKEQFEANKRFSEHVNKFEG